MSKQPAPTPSPWARKADSAVHGYGLYAAKDIPSGTRVIEYVGEKISKTESDQRDEERRAREVLAALGALRDATAVLVVPTAQLPTVVQQLAQATAAAAARARGQPPEGAAAGGNGADTAGGGASGLAGGGEGALGGDGGEGESAARAALLELLKCRSDFRDGFGRRAAWVKDSFPDVDGTLDTHATSEFYPSK